MFVGTGLVLIVGVSLELDAVAQFWRPIIVHFSEKIYFKEQGRAEQPVLHIFCGQGRRGGVKLLS